MKANVYINKKIFKNMKKSGLFAILFAFFMTLMPLAFAAPNLDVQKIDKGAVVISEINNPAVFDFLITNNGLPDTFEIYSLVGVTLSPRGTFDLPKGTTEIEVTAYPNKDVRRQLGNFIFEYEIKGQTSGIFKDKLTIEIINLKDAIEVKSSNFNIYDTEARFIVKNLENTHIDDLPITFISAFFEETEIVSLNPYGQTTAYVNIDKSRLRNLSAGDYIVTAIADPEDSKVKLESTVKYLESIGTSIEKTNSGIIIRKTTFTRINDGNVPTTGSINIGKDAVSRLFTTYSAEPLNSSRSGFLVRYVWEKQLKPGESFSITATTNYTLPFVLLVLIALIVIMIRIYSRATLVLEKRVSFVKTKGDEFALRVKIHVKSKKHIDNIQIIDKLPNGVVLYEKYGTMPDKIDKAARRLFWNINSLNAGEERVFSYVIHSKIKIVGTFELSPATALYEKDDKTYEVFSNKTFFVTETRG